jgi:transcriptional regulator with XRE-family HTH domain
VGVNIHYNHIGRYGHGDSRPSADTLHKLADVLGISRDYLLGGENKEAVKAKFEDVALLKIFQKSEHLPENDKMIMNHFWIHFFSNTKFKA